MPFDVHGALLVAVVAGVTALIRFLPFVVFAGGRPTPRFIVYLAGVLPCAIIAMLVVYCLRGVNRKMNALLGPDTGFDMINTATCGGEIAQLLSALNDTDECPKTIIYSLNPGDDAQIGTILGCFQNLSLIHI